MNTTTALNILLEYHRERFTLVDVGARWGADEKWMQLNEVADIICFEPDREECERLNAAKPLNVCYLPIGLSDTAGERDLFITKEPACSSNFEPITELYENYPGLFIIRPTDKTIMPCKRLDDALMQHDVKRIDAIKLDTQGSELFILKGGESFLSSCSIIDVEVEFNPIYKGQPLFSDVDKFLREHGFVLWRFNDFIHYPTEYIETAPTTVRMGGDPGHSVYPQLSNGQLFWAQAQYVRAEYPRTGMERMSLEDAIAPAILSGVYGWWDLALELIRKTGENEIMNRLRPLIQSHINV